MQTLSSQPGSGAGKQDDLTSEEQTVVTRATPAATNADRAAELARQTGDISLYQYYLKFAGAGTFVFGICALFVYSFCIVFPSEWSEL